MCHEKLLIPEMIVEFMNYWFARPNVIEFRTNFLGDALFIWDMLQHMRTWLWYTLRYIQKTQHDGRVYTKQFHCLSYSRKGIGNMLLWSLENRYATVHTYFDHSKCEDFTWPLQLIFPASTFCFSVPVALQLWQNWIESDLLEHSCAKHIWMPQVDTFVPTGF